MRDDSHDFTCRQCGDCCRWQGHVLLTDHDIERLSDALGMSESKFVEEYTELASNRAQLTLRDNSDGSCILLSGSACSVYDARPDQCRHFPDGWSVPGGCAFVRD